MMTISTRPYYRRIIFLYTVAIVALGAILTGVGIFTLLPEKLGDGYGAVLSTVKGIKQVLFVKLLGMYGVMSVLLITAVVILHLLYSHRIAGPAFRLAREALTIARGNLKGNIKFRRKDSLTEMADALNLVAAEYRTRVAALNNSVSSIESQADSIDGLINKNADEQAIEEIVDKMSAALKNMNAVLSEIRT